MKVESAHKPLGLVLSGGGAKGAYHVGVVRALVENRIDVDMVAGASIGALNGAIVAASPTLATSVERLEEVWGLLAQKSPLEHSLPGYLRLLAAVAPVLHPAGRVAGLGALAARLASRAGLTLPGTPAADHGLLADKPLTDLLSQYLDLDELGAGLPLYASIYRSAGGFADLVDAAVAAAGVCDTPDSEFVHVQSLSREVQRESLLASAALPVLFASREINEGRFADGGLGGWMTMQGNTPAQPLIAAGCGVLIVTHLSDASAWSKARFPGVTVIEIRPQRPMARSNGVLGGTQDLMGFDQTKLASWIEQGYEDATACLGRIRVALDAMRGLEASEDAIRSGMERDDVTDRTLRDSLARLV